MSVRKLENKKDQIAAMIGELCNEDCFDTVMWGINFNEDIQDKWDEFIDGIDIFYTAGEGTLIEGMTDEQTMNMVKNDPEFFQAFVEYFKNL